MTSVAGAYLNATPCCGKTYCTPRYRSMNFSAREYWTDGYCEGSLMPNGHGLRRCACGNFYLLRELLQISEVEQAEGPFTVHVEPEELPLAIAQARTPDIEEAARMDYWHHLNHDYRQRYRQHRDAEEARTEAQWHAQHPDTRSWWQKLRKVSAPRYQRPANAPFTYPPYTPSETQRENMQALLQLLQQKQASGQWVDAHTTAELHRALGQFEQATQALQTLEEKEKGVTSKLMAKLIAEKETAPMRYRM